MSKFNIKFKGIDSFVKGMDSLKVSSGNKTKDLVKKYGSKLQQSEHTLAPVDTGFLKRSIRIEIEDEGLTAVITPEADYAAYQEYGTRFQPGTPFVRPSLNKVKPEFERELKKLVGKK